MSRAKSKTKLKGRTSFEMTVCVRDIRAEDDGVKERIRLLLALVKLELLSRVLKHASEESCTRTAPRAIEYQNPFTLPPTAPVSHRSRYLDENKILTSPSTPCLGQRTI